MDAKLELIITNLQQMARDYHASAGGTRSDVRPIDEHHGLLAQLAERREVAGVDSEHEPPDAVALALAGLLRSGAEVVVRGGRT